MKILFYYPGDLSVLKRGTPIRSAMMCAFLGKTHEVHLAAAALPPDFSVKGTAFPSAVRGFNWLSRALALRRLIREFKPDIVYGQTHRSLFTLWLATVGGPPACADLHGVYHEERGANAVHKRLLKLWTDFLVRRIGSVTVPCHALGDLYARHAQHVHVLPGGIDMEAMRGIMPEKVRQDDVPVIAYCGNLRDYQGVEYLLQALQSIRDLSWHFLFVCSSEEERAKAMLERFDLSDRTTLLTNLPQPRVFALLKGSQIAVVPRPDVLVTRYAFPSKLPEYLGSGAAVIATDVSDAKHMVRPHETGWLVPPGNSIALADALRDALSNPALRQKAGAAAIELVERSYDWKPIIANLSSFLYSLKR